LGWEVRGRTPYGKATGAGRTEGGGSIKETLKKKEMTHNRSRKNAGDCANRKGMRHQKLNGRGHL